VPANVNTAPAVSVAETCIRTLEWGGVSVAHQKMSVHNGNPVRLEDWALPGVLLTKYLLELVTRRLV
jgi:hypothetical protein